MTIHLGGMNWGQAGTDTPEQNRVYAAVMAGLENHITSLDLADIYQAGRSESVLGALLSRYPGLRRQVRIQTKCGIRRAEGNVPGRYDSSAAHILASVDASLHRLQTDHIDVLLLHRPDPLADSAEIAWAFSQLKQAGKVLGFGVSNMHAGQMAWLQRALDMPLLANQLEMSLLKRDWLDGETTFNDAQAEGVQAGWAGTLPYCQQHRVQLQAWRPLCRGWLSGGLPQDASTQLQSTAALVAELANAYAVSCEAIVLAWLMRHPAGIQPVIGSMQADRIAACAQAHGVTLSRDDWYKLYVSARGHKLP